jgi:hypothetical protein
VYEQQLPADGGSPGIVEEPQDITRFETARVEWIGGSNYADTPLASVERCVEPDPAACDPQDPGDWQVFADGFGEVEAKVNYPQPQDLPAWRAGAYEWNWVATFEAFDSDIVLPDAQGVPRQQTPAGVYRFAIEGCHRGQAPSQEADPRCPSYEVQNRVAPYTLFSEPFEVKPWDGITVEDIRVEPGGTVSFEVGPAYLAPAGEELLPSYSNTDGLFAYGTASDPIDYPNTYDSPFRFIHPRSDADGEEDADDWKEYDPSTPLDDEVFCFHCSFRPWADTGAVQTARVTILRKGGRTHIVPARYEPASGRWVTTVRLRARDRAFVDRGGVVDTFGEFNGQPSATVTRPR